ncbi:MAG: HD domain-containing protein [Proteobacteria bacterium]|nr:HD domain-containing protein [Pseudomonadota bacterium]
MFGNTKTYEIRCPVYGFIHFHEWERDIINHKYFQRLRRIRQLGGTDLVYPGAMHTRFEHSLGVMQMVTTLYDGIIDRSKEILVDHSQASLDFNRMLLRLAALLHDIGHAPFSHASESLFPEKPDGLKGKYTHEDYSALITRKLFKDVIDDNRLLYNHGITANKVAGLIEGSQEAEASLYWRDLLSGQLDADRMDYLLRDSIHAGVDYGRYDWRRVSNTIIALPVSGKEEQPNFGVNAGGFHAAEGLILARYFMFTQVYFHKTRIAYDHHLQETLSTLLPDRQFPPPTEDCIEDYLSWDDGKVLGLLSEGKGGEHGRRMMERDHYRLIRETPETPQKEDIEKYERWKERLGELLRYEGRADKSWYKADSLDLPVVSETTDRKVRPLSELSGFISKINPIQQIKLYVAIEDRDEAIRRLAPMEDY